MELTSLREFYQKSEDKNIKLYQEYLAAAKRDVSEGLVEAKKLFGEQDSSVIEISEKISFIERVESIIANSIKEIINNSIMNMSDAELAKIIDDYIKGLEQEQENNNKKLEDLNKERDQLQNQYVSEMNRIGYDENYYKAVDTDVFFSEIKSAEDYTMGLVKSNLDKEALRATFSWLYASEDIQTQLADMILSLRKIAKISDEAVLKRAIAAFLSPEKIGRIVGIKEKNECLKTFEALQKELKMRTEFFERLPEELRNEIKDNGVTESETYHNLYEFYLEHQNTGHIYMPVCAGVALKEESIQELKEQMTELDKKIAMAKSACENRYSMMVLVESFISFEDNGDYTYSRIAKEAVDQRNLEQSLNGRIAELTQKLENLEEIENKLKSLISIDEYKAGFDILEARRESQIKGDLSANNPDFEIEAIKNAERRRLDQFKALGMGIAALEHIHQQIDDVDNNRNIIKNVTGANKKLRFDLQEQYRQKVEEIYDDLNERNLLLIKVAHNYMDVEEEISRKPFDFDKLLSRAIVPKYTVDDELYAELVDKKLVKEYYSKETLNNDFERAYTLALKLFKASKRIDGIYDFEITLAEIDELVKLYEGLVTMYETLYFMRECEKDRVNELARRELNEKFEQLISELNLNISTVSFADVEKYYDSVRKQIYDVRNELKDVNGEIPEEYCMDSQYNVLEGFDETCLPSDEIKKIVSFH